VGPFGRASPQTPFLCAADYGTKPLWPRLKLRPHRWQLAYCSIPLRATHVPFLSQSPPGVASRGPARVFHLSLREKRRFGTTVGVRNSVVFGRHNDEDGHQRRYRRKRVCDVPPVLPPPRRCSASPKLLQTHPNIFGWGFEMKEIEQVRAVPCGPYGPNEKWSVMFPTRRENLVHRPSETRTPDATTGALDIVPGNPR